MTTTTTTTATDAWINHGIPGREASGAFGAWERVPPLGGVNLFPHITNLELARKHREAIEARVRSPTGCGLVPDCIVDPGPSFYISPQGSVTWSCASDSRVTATRVYSDVNGFTAVMQCCVAASLGEFFTRMAIESDLWHRAALDAYLPGAALPASDYPESVGVMYLAFYNKAPAAAVAPAAQPSDETEAPAVAAAAAAAAATAVPPLSFAKAAVPSVENKTAAAAATVWQRPETAPVPAGDAGAFRLKPRVALKDVSGALKTEVERVMALFARGFASTVYTLADDPDTLYNKVVYTPVGDGARVSRRVESGPGCCGNGHAETYSCLGAAAELNWYLQRYHKSDVLRTTNSLPLLARGLGVVFGWDLPGGLQLVSSTPAVGTHSHADPAVMRRMNDYHEAARRHTGEQRRRLHLLLVDLCASFRAARAANGTALDFAALGAVV